jgi:soluble lytic murein transglycosylase-like protein
MTSILLTAATASAMFVSTAFHSSALPQTLDSGLRQNDEKVIPLTRDLPEKNFVAYPVQTGDTLQSIAHDTYGDSSYWTVLWNNNPWVEDPDKLEAGRLLRLDLAKPEKSTVLTDELKARFDKLHPVMPEVQAVAVEMPQRDYPQSSFEDVYKEAGARFGVPWQILYGIHLTETGLRNGVIFSHSGSGAAGPMQFMPGTFRAYAVEGHPDIYNAVDAIYAAANFMAKHGSLMAGLRSYGGNIAGTLAAARAKGYTE